jgi:cellulose synthase/poly-beta-1,6-N-acetylglucosamine synthase-like glycosyltransferase
MNPPWHIAVIVPARDEQALLLRCLASLDEACRALPMGVSSDVIVVADTCTDATVSIAREWMCGHEGAVIETRAGSVGKARAMGVAVALSRYQGPLDRCWLANTDADCEIPVSWLLDQLTHASAEIASVAGIVDVDTFEEHGAHVEERFRRTYQLNADGTHPHIHGANLGVRADAYRDVGGWSEMVTAEDHDLWGRLRLAKFVCVSDVRLWVRTSGRRTGRAPLGFADALAAHNELPG